MDATRRKAENEAFFRRVNERIEDVADDVFDQAGSEPRVWEFVCECHRESCVERLPMTVPEYERVRSDAHRFVVAPEHADPSIERVVERGARYWVVEKLGEAGDVAEATSSEG